ncbi:MAG: PotD/PotF family extracellular solute-binding protein, partial [Alphaproteobacteria bacterium]
ALAAMLATGGAGAVEINLMTWGGHYLDTYNPLVRDFEKETGIKVNIVVQAGAKDGLTKITAQRNDPQVDVWGSIQSTAEAAAEAGLLAPIDPAKLPNLKDVPKEFLKPSYVTVVNSARGIIYRKDLVPFEIKDWQDLWDPRLKRRVGLSYVIDTGSTLVMAALVGGGSEKNIEPGFARMREMKPNIAGFFNTDPESVKFLENGEFAVIGYAILANFYLKLGPNSNLRFVMPEKPKFLAGIPFAIVKGRGAEREAASHRFIDYLLSPSVQEFVTGRFGQIPVNSKAKLPENLRGAIPDPPLTNIYDVDWGVVNANYGKWKERWDKEIQSR